MSNFKGYVVTAPDGKSYDVNAPEGTSEEELYAYVQQTYYPTTAVEGEVNESAPLIGNQEETLATRTLEEVPGAQAFLDAEFRKGTQFNDVEKMYNERFGASGKGLAPDSARVWAENKAFAETPEGKKWFETNSPIAPVNRATGFEDPLAPDSMLEEFGVAGKKSLANMANTFTGAAGLAADLMGQDEEAEMLLDTYLEKQAAIQQEYPTRVGMAKDIENFSDAGYWAANTLGDLLPQITGSAGAGALGAGFVKRVARDGVREYVEDRVASGVAREVAEQEVARIVAKKALKGGVATAAVPSFMQSTGSVYGDTYGETGERSPWTSLLAATAVTALDTVLPAFVLKKLNIGGDVAKDAVAQSLIKRLGKDGASAFLLEGGTEALQTVIEQLPAGEPINWDQVIEAGLRGGFGGSVVGGAAGAYEGARINNSVKNAPVEFEGEPIVVPTARGKRSNKVYQEQLGQAQDGVINRVNQLTADWQNAPTFEVYKNFLDLQDAPNDVVGLYRDGKVYLNTENIIAEAKSRDVSPEDIVSGVTFHEALGHYGLAQQFGDDLDNTLANILANSKVYQGRVQKWMEKNPDAYKGNPNRDILALEEILAERSEKGRMPASIINIFKNKIKDFGRQMGLNLEYSTREVETILGMSHAAVVNGKSRAEVRDNGYRTMYAGPKAEAAPRDRSRWFSGPDGKDRFEFSDEQAYLFEEDLEDVGTATYLPKVLDHKELFKQYPALRNTRVKLENMPSGELGYYNPLTNVIALSVNNPNKLSTLLHELQHNIQEIEGFDKGGNMNTAVSAMSDDHVMDTAKNYVKYQKKLLKELDLELEAVAAFSKTELGRKMIEARNLRDFTSVRELGDEAYKQLLPKGFEGHSQKDGDEFLTLMEYFENPWKNYYDIIEQKDLQRYFLPRKIKYLEEDIADENVMMLRTQLQQDSEVNFQAYEALLGEVEARDTQARQFMNDEERAATAPYTSQNERVPPSAYVIPNRPQQEATVSASMTGMPRSGRDGSDVLDSMTEIERERRGLSQYERMAAGHQRDLDADKPSVANDRYMRMSNPDMVKFTPEEIAEMTPEELFDSENALNILEGMTEGYTPIVMSLDDLKSEVEDRGLSPSKVLRKNGLGAGELVKRLYMYDIAMTKMNDRLSNLWEKIETGQFTVDDKAAYLRGVLKRDELAGRIFEDQGEIGRALAALKSIQYTRRRVKGMQETLVQFKQGTPYEALNDPDVFYKFAAGIQEQINEAKQKAKDKGKEFIGNALNLPRSLMSSMDFSAPLRQGLFLIHKPAWWRSFSQMFRYAGDQKAYDDLMEDITNRPTYDEMVRGNLALSDIEGKLTAREEDFMSNWAEKIPFGIGKFVKGSNRAYAGFLNKLRADVFDELVANLPEGYTEKDLKDVTRFINAASGRGNLPTAMQSSVPLLNALFFSPRLISSRATMLTSLVDPRTYITMNKAARMEYVKSLLTVGSLGLLINSLAILGGAEGEEDPRSSDFGKVKVGNTRFDVLGGSGQYVTLASRLALNSYKTSDGNIKKYGNKIGETTQLDAIGKFFTNKAAPIPSFVMDYFRGEDAVGNKFEMDKAILSRFAPLFAQDVMENVQEMDAPTAAFASAAGLFGVGSQTFTPASLDTEKDLEAPDTFKMADAVDGDYGNAIVADGEVTLDEKAKIEWASRINFYYKEWMKEEMEKPEWKSLDNKEKKKIIKEVRDDARKEAKLDMLDLLAIPTTEDEEEEALNDYDN